MDYYKILNVSKNATNDEIKRQYKKLALKHHPDRGGDSEMFKKVSEAYQILSDPEKKSEYDNPNPFSHQMPRGTHFYHTRPDFVDPNIIFQHFFNNRDFFQQPQSQMRDPQTRNTTTFNIRTGPMGNMRGNVFQKSVSTQIRGNTKIETITEIKNGVKTQTVKQTNLETGQATTDIKQIDS